jgi:hypothetical protein
LAPRRTRSCPLTLGRAAGAQVCRSGELGHGPLRRGLLAAGRLGGRQRELQQQEGAGNETGKPEAAARRLHGRAALRHENLQHCGCPFSYARGSAGTQDGGPGTPRAESSMPRSVGVSCDFSVNCAKSETSELANVVKQALTFSVSGRHALPV